MASFKKELSVLVFIFFSFGLQGQVEFGKRIETLKNFSLEPVWIETSENYFIAFQSNVVDASRQINLNLFFAKQDFTEETFLEIPLKWSYVIRKPKAVGNKFYFLCESRDRELKEYYFLVIDPNSKETLEIDLQNVIRGRILEFEVMEDRILFLIISQNRIVAQILEISTNKIYTVDDIYQRGMVLQEVFHDELSKEFHLLFSFRKRDNSKSFFWSTLDKEGIILNNILLEQTLENLENIEFLLTDDGALPFVAGTIGETKKIAYKGYYAGYLSQGINPFKSIIEISELKGFFSFEKDGGEKSLKKWQKSGRQSLNGVLSSRGLIQNEFGYLLHSDYFRAVGNSFYLKDGLYDYNYYQLNPMKDLTIGRRVIVDNFTDGFGQSPSIVEGYFNELGQPILIGGDPRIYFSFISSHFLQLDFDGNVLWDYAIPLPKKSTFVPLSYGQILTGKKDHFLYTFDDKLIYSLISMGEIEMMNMEILLPDHQKPGKMLKSEYYNLELKSLNNGSFLLTGRQRLRFVDENDVAQDQDILFFQELNVNEF